MKEEVKEHRRLQEIFGQAEVVHVANPFYAVSWWLMVPSAEITRTCLQGTSSSDEQEETMASSGEEVVLIERSEGED